ncbi:UNVERIFIED_CONTAM: Transcription factor GTE12 [Sesamum angustifolium]|uniref:Transcription factor GTE12 n=1 Tax=Sesamum angustifolium TaxID=2727405 RepID=A0AAW2PD61_9LAMI
MVMVADNQGKIRSCYPVQFPTMLAEDNTAPRKLKFKITTKGIRDDSGDKSRENVVKLVINCGRGDRVAGVRNKLSEANVLVNSSVPAKSNKRRPETSLDDQRGIRRKIDSNMKTQCGNILKELMSHPDGWIFSEPVDPVKLNIPDYFSVITDPMDLGTIKRKLEGNMYFGAEDFAADVRLTFSNAMLYNPPDNRVHSCAKKLDGNFSRRWKLMEAKMQHGKNVEQASRVDYVEKNGQYTKQTVEKVRQETKLIGLNKAALRIKVGTYKPMSFEEKQKFRLELVQVLSKKMTEKLRNVFQKFGLTGLDKRKARCLY